MADIDRSPSRVVRMTAEEITGRSFSSKVRGVSETEVRTFLRRIAEEMDRLGAREDELIKQVSDLKDSLSSKPALTKAELLETLGEQTTRVLSSAEEAAEKILDDAKIESEQLRTSTQSDTQRQMSEAKAQADQTISDAQSRARALQESSQRDADTVIEEARAHGREIFQESVVVREQILKDLLRRRDLLVEQIEQLRKGRDELLDSYKIVKGSFQQATDALHNIEEKAAHDLAQQPIDVDALLKAPVELPGILDSKNPAPISGSERASEEKSDAPVVTAEPSTRIYDQSQDEVSEGEESREEIPEITGKRTKLKNYMKDALGVGEGEESDSEDSADVSETVTESVVLSTALPEVKTEVKEAPKSDTPAKETKDVGALFKSLKEQKQGEEAPAPQVEASETAEEVKEEVEVAEKKPAKKKSSKKNPIEIRDSALSSVMSGLMRKAKRQLNDEQNELLESLRTIKSKKRVSAENILSDEATYSKSWEEVLRNDCETVFASGVASFSKDKVTCDANDVALAVSWMVTPLRETLTHAIDEGEYADATTRVGARYREWRSTELKAALTDVLCGMYNAGVLAAAKKKGDVTVSWTVEKPGRCPDCDDNALEPTGAGEAFPTGQSLPPAHSGCRCVLTVA